MNWSKVEYYWLNPKELYKIDNKEDLNSLKKITHFLDEVFDDVKPTQRLWHVYNNVLQVVKCKTENCYNPCKWNKKERSYRKFCSTKCSVNHPETLKKKTNSIQKKYGVENVSQNEEIKDKKRNIWVKKYGVDHPSKSQDIKNKIKSTNLKVYGFENPNQCFEIKNKREKTCIERFGVKSNLATTSHKERMKDKFGEKLEKLREKSDQNSIEKHGVVNVLRKDVREKAQNSKRKKRIAEIEEKTDTLLLSKEYHGIDYKEYYQWFCRICGEEFQQKLNHRRTMPYCPSCKSKELFTKFEKEMFEFLKSLIPEKDIVIKDRNILKGKELDFLIPTKAIAIECNGSYWHSEIAGKSKNYHKNKTEECEGESIKLIHIWEHEWSWKRNIIKSVLSRALNHPLKKIHGRKCSIQFISNKQCKDFLDKNHIQGGINSSINIALIYSGDIVGVASFGKARFSAKYEYELTRLCFKNNTVVIGGSQKVFKAFVKEINPSSIVSYCDISKFDGKLYNTLGFNKVKRSSPNYFYTKDYKNFLSRNKFQKHKLKNVLENYEEHLSEWENMKNNGYNRIWDCGNDVYEWRKI